MNVSFEISNNENFMAEKEKIIGRIS